MATSLLPASGPWMWAYQVDLSWPSASMTSTSPLAGQPAVSMSSPIAQNAGHRPLPAGSFMRDSRRP